LSAAAERTRSEGLIVLLVAAIQFINILDFVIPLPMGPDLARGLGFGTNQIGLIGSAYTYAAAVSGLAGSFFLDRFDRRKVVAVAMSGLVLGTAAGGLAQDLPSLMAARILAGLFGGPATSVAMSIVADVVPVERRGVALSRVMAAFSVAQVLGTPIALELALRLGWRAPFFATAAAGLLVVGLAVAALPPVRGHLDKGGGPIPPRQALKEAGEILRTPLVQLSYLTTAVVMAGGFILIPNISAYVQDNIGYPREHLGRLYFGGGIASFAAMMLVGRLVDRYGPFRTGLVGALALCATIYVGFVNYTGFPVLALYVAFMVSAAFRNVPYNTLASRVPQPRWRARFMSFQSAVQHVSSAVGANASVWILGEAVPGQPLKHIEVVAMLSIALTICVPVLLHLVETRVKARDALQVDAQRSALAPS
jgi:predicted MFS family arabinose efflux permease